MSGETTKETMSGETTTPQETVSGETITEKETTTQKETTQKEMTTQKETTTPEKVTTSMTDKKADSIAKKTNTDKKEIKGATFAPLKLKASAGKKSVKLTWSKVKKSDGYIIYGGRCGKKLKKIKTVSKKNSTITVRKLSAGKYYKFAVMAYKKDGKSRKIINISTCAHCCVKGGKHGNPIKISNVKSSLVLKKNKKCTVYVYTQNGVYKRIKVTVK